MPIRDQRSSVTTTDERPATAVEEVLRARIAELEDELAQARKAMDLNAELRDLTRNLDQVVRQRTRALAESEYQLRRKNLELERLSGVRRDFIAIAAHELRTPLTSLIGYLDLFSEKVAPGLDAEARRQLYSLHRSSHRLKRLVDDMLDVAHLETGNLPIRRGPCSLPDVVNAVVEEVRPLCGALRRFELEIGDVPSIDADADKLHQAVANIIVNAIKYAAEDSVIRIVLDHASTRVRLCVRLEGRSIPAALRDRLFEPFLDLDSAKHHSSRGPDSAGFGLRIARGIVELHGGSIAVDSEEEKYFELAVVLPAPG